MPFTITLRHILIADATPYSSDTGVTAKPSAASSGVAARACGPPSSIGVRMPCGGTDVMTAAST